MCRTSTTRGGYIFSPGESGRYTITMQDAKSQRMERWAAIQAPSLGLESQGFIHKVESR
jgi:hypothetical protein